jgi:hypothetical protein
MITALLTRREITEFYSSHMDIGGIVSAVWTIY